MAGGRPGLTFAYAWPAILWLNLELDQWRRLGRRPILWWRDDDSREPTPRLERLLEVAGDRPLTLAVIPDRDLAPLAGRLGAAPNVRVFQHGVDHHDVLASPGAECEYGNDVSAAEVARRIVAAKARMHAVRLAPAAYAPPWNRIDARLLEALPMAGFDMLSAGAHTPAAAGMRYLPTHVDILRWKGGPRFRGVGRVLRSLRGRLTALRRAADFEAPTGLLTHHLDHDEAAWDFLAWLTAYAEGRFVWADGSAMAR